MAEAKMSDATAAAPRQGQPPRGEAPELPKTGASLPRNQSVSLFLLPRRFGRHRDERGVNDGWVDVLRRLLGRLVKPIFKLFVKKPHDELQNDQDDELFGHIDQRTSQIYAEQGENAQISSQNDAVT